MSVLKLENISKFVRGYAGSGQLILDELNFEINIKEQAKYVTAVLAPSGAGKTTLTRGFLQGLGFSGKVKSPTYSLVEPYHINQRNVFHFDFYRIENSDELEHIGLDDYFKQQAVCLIEWPEKGAPLLPTPDLACYITFMGAGRSLRLEAYSPAGQHILTSL